ncbi:D-serine ammonia-lyase [Emcibacter sp.]|uniref:D-serine ammonia-lyase n=1 Tax=Emcibacter sp. TaxID=1979954 RepID=UPI002AA728D4|nr:D-serine ammonia-lyase [Emcibacter sp.]
MNIVEQVKRYKEFFWVNPRRGSAAPTEASSAVTQEDFTAAFIRFRAMAPLLEKLFPELNVTKGEVRSKLYPAASLLGELIDAGDDMTRLFIKADHDLPVAGSIKARGGIFEVVSHAWDLALQEGYLFEGDPVEKLAGSEIREKFASRVIAVGSTGNLGLSVGIVGRALGFQVEVHMSRDAKAWKKQRLREHGAQVIEYDSDFTTAVHNAAARAESQSHIYFVNDEYSRLLFLGYSVAAFELQEQLLSHGILIGPDCPLFLYLPCGIGGAPGGIAFGAGQLFGDHVHPFFAEPVAAPSMLLEMLKEHDGPVSVYDYGLDNRTEADGLAVGTASKLVSDLMRSRVSGIYTVNDENLMQGLFLLKKTEDLRVEPSAAAGVFGPERLYHTEAGREYLKQNNIANAVHVIWTTGGCFLPDKEYESFYCRGERAYATK